MEKIRARKLRPVPMAIAAVFSLLALYFLLAPIGGRVKQAAQRLPEDIRHAAGKLHPDNMGSVGDYIPSGESLRNAPEEVRKAAERMRDSAGAQKDSLVEKLTTGTSRVAEAVKGKLPDTENMFFCPEGCINERFVVNYYYKVAPEPTLKEKIAAIPHQIAEIPVKIAHIILPASLIGHMETVCPSGCLSLAVLPAMHRQPLTEYISELPGRAASAVQEKLKGTGAADCGPGCIPADDKKSTTTKEKEKVVTTDKATKMSDGHPKIAAEL
jgi:hypothetical protein